MRAPARSSADCEQISPSGPAGMASRTAGSAASSSSTGSSGSAAANPNIAGRCSAAPAASAAPTIASSKPHPHLLRVLPLTSRDPMVVFPPAVPRPHADAADPRRSPVPFDPMREAPGILARGPWSPDQVTARWMSDAFAPAPAVTTAADAAVAALAERGSPSHDGVAARLVSHSVGTGGELIMELQPARWSLRLVESDACRSVAALCAVRDSDGRWLAGRRATWLASWPGRWALGAGGAVDGRREPGRHALARAARRSGRWTPEQVRGEALVLLPHAHGDVHRAGVAARRERRSRATPSTTSTHGGRPTSTDWPDEADEPLRRMARLLDGAA